MILLSIGFVLIKEVYRMKNLKTIIIILSFAAVLISGTIGVLAYTSKSKTKRTIETKQDNEGYNKLKANSVEELFSLDNVIVDYENAPDNMKALMKYGTDFSYNGISYHCYPDHSAVRRISSEDAKRIMAFEDVEECSSFQATCVLRMLLKALDSSAISTLRPDQNSNIGLTVYIFEGNDCVLFAGCNKTGGREPETFIKTVDIHEMDKLNLLLPGKGEFVYLSRDDIYVDTFCKILELFSGFQEEIVNQFRDGFSSK